MCVGGEEGGREEGRSTKRPSVCVRGGEWVNPPQVEESLAQLKIADFPPPDSTHSPEVEEDGGPKHHGREELALTLGEPRHNVGDHLVEHGGGGQ